MLKFPQPAGGDIRMRTHNTSISRACWSSILSREVLLVGDTRKRNKKNTSPLPTHTHTHTGTHRATYLQALPDSCPRKRKRLHSGYRGCTYILSMLIDTFHRPGICVRDTSMHSCALAPLLTANTLTSKYVQTQSSR